MAKDLKEQIQIMTHYLNGGEVEFYGDFNRRWEEASTPVWDWRNTDYRIKEQKKTITIEKWLLQDGNAFEVFELNKERLEEVTQFDIWKKAKLLETYEVEL